MRIQLSRYRYFLHASTMISICIIVLPFALQYSTRESRKKTLIPLSRIHCITISCKINRIWTRNSPTLFFGQRPMRYHAIIDHRLRATGGKISSKCIRGRNRVTWKRRKFWRPLLRRRERGRERRTRTSRFIPSDPAWHALRQILPATGRQEIVFYDGTRAYAGHGVSIFLMDAKTRETLPFTPERVSPFWNASIIMTSDMHCDLAVWIIVPSSDCYGA